MKKFLLKIIITLLPFSIYAIGGLGLQFGQGVISVGELETGRAIMVMDNKIGEAGMITEAFENPLSGGVHIYIDAIPFIDLEADINLITKKYTFNFYNFPVDPLTEEEGDRKEIGPYEFRWGSASTYITIRKKLLGLGIPFLAKAKLFYGGGYNQHKITPLITLDLMEGFLDGDLTKDPTDLSEKDLIEELKDNVIDASGFHLQAGLQFKVLVLDTFLFYRHTFAKDLVPESDSFGSLNFRIGLGI